MLIGETVTAIATVTHPEGEGNESDGYVDFDLDGDEHAYEIELFQNGETGEWEATTSWTPAKNDQATPTVDDTGSHTFKAKVDGDYSPSFDSQPFNVLAASIKLRSSETIVEVNPENPPKVTLRATVAGGYPDEDITYFFYAGNTLIHTSLPTPATSYAIDLNDPDDVDNRPIFGLEPEAARMRVETDQPDVYKLPSGSGDGGAPFAEDHLTVENERDNGWATLSITGAPPDNVAITGQILSLNAVFAPVELNPSFQWSIGGNSIHDFETADNAATDDIRSNFETGSIEPTENFDDKQSIKFTWLNAGQHTVTVTASVGEKSVEDKMEVKVVKPTGDLTVHIAPPANNPEPNPVDAPTADFGGRSLGLDRAEFEAVNLQIPAPFAGNGTFFLRQFVTLSSTKTIDEDGSEDPFKGSLPEGGMALDGGESYQSFPNNGGLITADAPGYRFGTAKTMTTSRSYKMYLMYKYSVPGRIVDAVPVPIQVVEWSFSGTARLDNNGIWGLAQVADDNGILKPDSKFSPKAKTKGTNTDDPPVWDMLIQ